VLPAHAQPVDKVELRPDGQVAYMKFLGANEPWYEVDLSTPGATPPKYSGPVPSDGVQPGIYAFSWSDRQ
jgi:hypothetical protein